ncbi:unnamed protein product, partial [Oppiella nova]
MGDCGEDLPTIVVTGFGLFRNYKSNPSWDCVQRLRLKGVNLRVEEIPVAYDEVDKRVALIWSRYKPFLVIHCGVSCLAKCITLETRALRHHTLYDKPDIYGRLPDGTQTAATNQLNCYQSLEPNDLSDCIESGINLKEVCHRVNQHFHNGFIPMPAVLSSNAG